MNGSLRVTSVPKQGSEFVLSLPLTVAAKPSSNRETVPREPVDSRRILVAEDSKPNQLVVQAMLERKGYEVDVANDGIEACAAVKRAGPGASPYCLILMDVQMPGMDGIEAARWIRNNGYSLPIIALTAKAFMEDEKACLDAGMNDFMTKPVNYDALLSRVEMWVGDESTKTSGLPGEKINEMRALMGEEAFKDALGVFTREVTERHERLRVVLAEEDFAKASVELHTLFGIYAGYGFEELQHLSRALQDSCDARLAPPAKSLQQFDELLSELLQKIEHYRAEAIA
jgi:two-component system sensor histidine kinase/response regulator